MPIQNPHDKFFKETFTNIAVAKDFLHNYLPANIMGLIDIDTLETQKDSFINPELQERFSDLLFKVKIYKQEGYIYFLFEHKSYPSRDIALQLLRYMIEIWSVKIKKEANNHLPLIIPLVIYHGQQKWQIKTTLGEIIPGYEKLPEDIKVFVPNYRYLLYDLSTYTDAEIKGEAQLRIFFTMLRDIYTKDGGQLINSILRAAEYLQIIADKQSGMEYFETLIRYIFNAAKSLAKNDIHKIIKQIKTNYPEGGEVVMTIARILREEGRMEGLLKGRKEGREDVARRSLLKGLAVEDIVEITGLKREIIEEIKKKINV